MGWPKGFHPPAPADPAVEVAKVPGRGDVVPLGSARRVPQASAVTVPRQADLADLPGAAVVTEGLTRRFGDQVAVDHVDLTVPRGTTFGLLGRNGAGKTTMIKMLITLLPQSEGTARVAGYDIRTQP